MALKDLVVRGPGPTGKPPRMIVKKEKPVPRQYKKGLRLDPVMINSDNWFYDTKRGLLFVHEVRFGRGRGDYLRTDQFSVPWRLIRDAVKRRDEFIAEHNLRTKHGPRKN